MGSTSAGAAAVHERLIVHRDQHPVRVATFAEDVRAGLASAPMRLAAKYFYDDLGSALFEAITRLPEYYLTRVERDLLASYGGEIVGAFGGPIELLELGSGSATKTRLIIEAALARQRELVYHPIDISSDALLESSLALVAAHDRLRVVAYAGDYFAVLGERRFASAGRTLALYLGSNIGNFEPREARALLESLAGALRSGDGLLIGYDLKKDPSILEAAYDDPTGVTAAFNKNLLARINRELGGDFDLREWSFRASWDEARGAVDSFLVAEEDLRVRIPAADVDMAVEAGATIHTESSYKFAREEIVALAQHCGFAERTTYTDAGGRYALTLLMVK